MKREIKRLSGSLKKTNSGQWFSVKKSEPHFIIETFKGEPIMVKPEVKKLIDMAIISGTKYLFIGEITLKVNSIAKISPGEVVSDEPYKFGG
jgi:hypothetical protein